VVGVRLGYFEGFKGNNTVLLDGDTEGLGKLANALLVLIAGDQDVVPLHSLAFVSAAKQVKVDAHRSTKDIGMLREAGRFQWRRSARGWAGVVEQILGVKERGHCHQYLDGPSDDVVVMVSSGEYGEPWPSLGSTGRQSRRFGSCRLTNSCSGR
jgi:hypothetical protein